MQVVTAARSRRTPAPRGPDDLLSGRRYVAPLPAFTPTVCRNSMRCPGLVSQSTTRSTSLSVSLPLSLFCSLRVSPCVSPFLCSSALSVYRKHPLVWLVRFSRLTPIQPPSVLLPFPWSLPQHCDSSLSSFRATPCALFATETRDSGTPFRGDVSRCVYGRLYCKQGNHTVVSTFSRVIPVPRASWNVHTIMKSTSVINGALRRTVAAL